MKGRVLYISSILILIFAIQGWAQTLVNARQQHKISINPFIGIAVFPGGMNYNALGIPKNIFGGYVPAPVIGASLWYKLRPKVFFGLNGSFLFTSRESNTLSILKFGLNLKYNLINPHKYFLSPYILAGVNVSFLNINQSKQVREFYPDDSTAIGEGLKPIRVDYKYNQLQMYMSPVFGPMFGGGVEAKISTKISLFLQATFETSFGTNGMIRDKYSENTSLLNFASIQVGTTIRLFKNVKVQIDTQAVYIPDLIAQLSPIPEEQDNAVQALRDVNFQIHLKEGIKHVLRLQNYGSEVNLEIQEHDTPCRKRAILYDATGNKLEELDVIPYQKIRFSALKRGIYKVSIEVQPPCTHTGFSYKIDESGNEILKRYNEEMLLEAKSHIDSTNEFILAKLSPENIKMYSFYNVEGNEAELSGFGYQVGAFKNIRNALHLMQKLAKDGFKIYTQTIMSDDINLRFKASQNYKFHRVIVFAGFNDQRAHEVREMLLNGGYEIIVKEHFSPDSKSIQSYAKDIKLK